MRLVLDAMGTDRYPGPDVAGAVEAAGEYGETIILVGDEAVIKAELAKHETVGLPLEVIHAEEVITGEDKPSDALRHKKKSSMHIGVKLVRDGEADAFITMGNSGAALAVATVLLRTIPGVLRAGLTTVIPTLGGNVVLNDIGVNADSKPEWLLQFAVMGSIYAERIVGIENPRVGLLSNGEEEGKGNDLVRDAAELLKASPLVHFIGNVEPKEVLKGETDVMIADGFTGNLFIKTIEATGSMLQTIIYEEIYRSWISKIGGLLARPALRRVRPRIDPMEIGGAILLGVNGVVIIGHGRSNPLGVKNAIRQARQAVHGEVVGAIREGLAETGIAASTGK